MRNRYIVSYDISNPKRLRRIFDVMTGFGDHLQYSVFRCDLSKTGRVQLIEAVSQELNHDEDQVLIIDLGPEDGRASTCVEAIGRPYQPPERHAVVV